MIEEFERKGWWWLPNNPEKKLSGTLRFTPLKGAILQLIGSFEEIEGITTVDDVFEPEIVLGESTGGKKITLQECVQTRLRLSLPGYETSCLRARVVFLGAHFQGVQDIRFKSMSVRYSHLDEWIKISGFDTKFGDEEVFIKYKRPESILVGTTANYRILINFSGPFYIKKREAQIREEIYFKMELFQEKCLNEYLNIMYHIQNFLSLAVLEPVYRIAIEGMIEKEDESYNQPVSIFYQLPNIASRPKALLQDDMLFTFPDVREKLPALLKNWLGKVESLNPVYDLYFGTVYSPRISLTHKFLNLAQAVESYHRRTMRNFELPYEQHEKRVVEILNAVPPSYKNWLKKQLDYSNELKLRARLREIIENFYDVLKPFIAPKDDFVQKVVITRNYWTHYDEKLKEHAAKGDDLYRLSQKLKILLEVCFLKELGFSSDDVQSLVSRNRRYQLMKHASQKGS